MEVEISMARYDLRITEVDIAPSVSGNTVLTQPTSGNQIDLEVCFQAP
jgi:hypothetical protein